MQISSASTSGADLLRQMLQAGAASSASAAGQTLPGGAASPAPAAGPPPGPPPPKPSNSASESFSADTLSALIASQAGESDPTSRAGDLANKLVSDTDADGDGKLSLGEVQSALTSAGDAQASTTVQKAFSALDTDGDGSLSTDELQSALQASDVGPGRHGTHHHGGGPREAGRPSAADAAVSIMGAADSDGDGALSLDEMTAAVSPSAPPGTTSASSPDVAKAFAALDSNGDGKVTASDLANALQSFMAAQASYGAQAWAGGDGASTAAKLSVAA